ncbi:hypothetical protein D3C78_1414220 [compost metagenome]
MARGLATSTAAGAGLTTGAVAAAGADGAATTGADCSGAAGATSACGGVAKLICSGSSTKQSTALMSSSLAEVSSVTSRLFSVCCGFFTSPRFPSSSSISGTSLDLRPLRQIRIPPSIAAGTATACSVAGCAAGASCCCASNASCRNAWQMYSKLSASGFCDVL